MDRLYAPWRMAYIDQPAPAKEHSHNGACVFCSKARSEDDSANLVVFKGIHSFVLMNVYPYTNGHVMVAPYDHTANLDDLSVDTLTEIMLLTRRAVDALRISIHPDGYNIGMNLGKVAGAGIADHLHMHIVPRWDGDTNFMPVIAETKILPDSLESSFNKLRAAWKTLEEQDRAKP